MRDFHSLSRNGDFIVVKKLTHILQLFESSYLLLWYLFSYTVITSETLTGFVYPARNNRFFHQFYKLEAHVYRVKPESLNKNFLKNFCFLPTTHAQIGENLENMPVFDAETGIFPHRFYSHSGGAHFLYDEKNEKKIISFSLRDPSSNLKIMSNNFNF